MPRGRSTLSMPVTTRPKNGSVNIRPTNGPSTLRRSASETTSATESVRRVTRDRAARLGT